MTRYFLITIFASLVLTSCSPSAVKKSAEIKAIEDKLRVANPNSPADTTAMKQLLGRYAEYVKLFPTDSLVPVYLMRSALFFQNVKLIDSAILCYDAVYTKFSGYPKASMALFSEAYLYSNDKHDLPKAKQLYELYLSKYPNGKMAPSAALEIKMLGKTPEQILAEMDSIRKAKKDSISLQP